MSLTQQAWLMRSLMGLLVCGWLVGLGCQSSEAPIVLDERGVTDAGGTKDSDLQERGQPKERSVPRDGSVGSLCDDGHPCQQGLTCETRIPLGYCTRSCLSSVQCPGGSACVRIKFREGPQYYRCLRTCYTNDDCRSQFTCYHPPGAWKLICLPEVSKP